MAVYLLSIVASYYLMKYMYTHAVPLDLAPVWSWITPVVNTLNLFIGFILCWKYFPITGLAYWKKRWDKPVSSLDAIEKSIHKELHNYMEDNPR